MANVDQNGNILGTLGSNNLMINPNVPRNSQAAGVQGSDGRAYTRNVQGGELVEKRLVDLLNSNSSYVRQAESGALNQARSRGLGNSSIAAGAGRKAAIQSALPIASQDAATMSQAAGQSTEALNNATMQERDIANKLLEAQMNKDAAGANAAASAAAAAQERELMLQMQRERLSFEGEQGAFDRQYGFDMAGYETQLRDMFSNNDLGRELTRMGADYEWRNTIGNNDAVRQDWLSNNNFNREFYGGMSTLIAGARLNSTNDFMNMLNSYALDNPDVFNAEDYTRFGGFVNDFMSTSFSNIMRDMFGGGGATTRPPRGG